MKKLLLIFFFLATLFAKSSYAAGKDFDVTSNTSYNFDRQGVASVTQHITIINLTDFIHAPTYEITLNIRGIEEMQVISKSGKSIPFTVNDTQNDGKAIKVVFSDRVVGKNTSQEFYLKYKTSTLAERLGNTWEVNIPGVKKSKFTDSKVSVTVPQSFGKASIIKPEKGTKVEGNKYTFTQEALSNAGALLVFGDAEYYRLDLKYTLENNNFFPLKSEIALPPSTSYQDVIYQKIDPEPKSIKKDTDGNYLAQYTLDPQEKISVNAVILVKTTPHQPEGRPLSDGEKDLYTQRQRYWEQSAQIAKLAQKYNTPQKIYEFLVTNFKYNYDRTAELSNRLGAANAIDQKDNLVCLEFTDLFVALARASSIPARSVEGYAYTTNPQVRPRALVKDVLHAWPQYYDEKKGTWIDIDPTWGNTTGGIDYFNSLDLSHIAFVVKGADSQYPIPAGGYSQSLSNKQVKVEFATPDDMKKNESVAISLSPKDLTNHLTRPAATITILNTGNTPILRKEVLVKDEKGNTKNYPVKNIPPFGMQEFYYVFPGNVLTKTTHQLTIQFEGQQVTKEITTGIDIKNLLPILGGIAIGTFILGLSAKLGSLYLSRRKK